MYHHIHFFISPIPPFQFFLLLIGFFGGSIINRASENAKKASVLNKAALLIEMVV